MNPPRPAPPSNRHISGFTLIEAVMVIAITGILFAIVAVFIVSPVKSYFASVRRAELTDEADLAVRRIAREIHIAVPNSVRVGDSSGNSGSCAVQPGVVCYIEFIPTSTGGRYRDVAPGNYLNFTTPNLTFDVLGPMPRSPAINVNDYIVVYNLGPGTAADAYTGTNRAQVAAVAVAGNLVTLTANPFAVQPIDLPSPNLAFDVVAGSVQAVTFACPTVTAGNLTRYWNYGFNASLATTPSGTSALLATNATCGSISWNNINGIGLLTLTLTLTDPNSSESVALFREIHVDNVP